MLSLGFVSPNSGLPGGGLAGGAAVMRGPMAGRVVSQLLKGTDWGSLDVLILDLPPGTGDVQLQLCQDIELSGAVAVTTPSNLSIIDSMKGIEMFNSLGVPTIAVVENMSYFECEGGGKHYPFGKGGKDALESLGKAFGLDQSDMFQMPISSLLNESNDSGKPLTLSRPNSAKIELGIYDQIARAVSASLFCLQYDQSRDKSITIELPDGSFDIDLTTLTLNIDNSSKGFNVRIFSNDSAHQIYIEGKNLRSRDPKTGRILTNGEIEAKNDAVIPVSVSKKGHYGFIIEWKDSSKIIYSLESIGEAISSS